LRNPIQTQSRPLRCIVRTREGGKLLKIGAICGPYVGPLESVSDHRGHGGMPRRVKGENRRSEAIVPPVVRKPNS
jgi:hypothetical protein